MKKYYVERLSKCVSVQEILASRKLTRIEKLGELTEIFRKAKWFNKYLEDLMIAAIGYKDWFALADLAEIRNCLHTHFGYYSVNSWKPSLHKLAFDLLERKLACV